MRNVASQIETAGSLEGAHRPHEGAERGGEAVGGEGGGDHTVKEPRAKDEGRKIPVQQAIRVQLLHSRPTLPHGGHLRHWPPHGARVRRPLP